MVRSNLHIQDLIGKALQSTRQLTPHLIRVQSGFLAESNIRDAQALADSLQTILRDVQTTLHSPPPHRNSPIVPLK